MPEIHLPQCCGLLPHRYDPKFQLTCFAAQHTDHSELRNANARLVRYCETTRYRPFLYCTFLQISCLSNHTNVTSSPFLPLRFQTNFGDLAQAHDQPGILKSRDYFNGLIKAEIEKGIPSNRIVLGMPHSFFLPRILGDMLIACRRFLSRRCHLPLHWCYLQGQTRRHLRPLQLPPPARQDQRLRQVRDDKSRHTHLYGPRRRGSIGQA